MTFYFVYFLGKTKREETNSHRGSYSDSTNNAHIWVFNSCRFYRRHVHTFFWLILSFVKAWTLGGLYGMKQSHCNTSLCSFWAPSATTISMFQGGIGRSHCGWCLANNQSCWMMKPYIYGSHRWIIYTEVECGDWWLDWQQLEPTER